MSEYLHGLRSTAPSLTNRTGFRAFACVACMIALQGQLANAETPLTKLRHETRELLKQEAVLDEGAAKDAAVASLCDLYVVLRSDDRYATSEMLQGDATKVRRRLLGTAHQRKAQLQRAGIERPANLSAEVDAAVSYALANEQANFRDRVEPSGQGGGALPDSGWQLVELLQRIVAPDFWDRQGGPGAIRYFAMRRVLVVRATSDVHEQIKDLLMALR